MAHTQLNEPSGFFSLMNHQVFLPHQEEGFVPGNGNPVHLRFQSSFSFLEGL